MWVLDARGETRKVKAGWGGIEERDERREAGQRRKEARRYNHKNLVSIRIRDRQGAKPPIHEIKTDRYPYKKRMNAPSSLFYLAACS